MAAIEILSWKIDFPGFTGWDTHQKSELKKRLRLGVNAPAAEIRRLTRQVLAHQVVILPNIRDEMLNSITQILQTMGAEISISFSGIEKTSELFKKLPKRR